MERYNCPVCDRAMKGKHYCSFCRQYVKKPYISKFDYYLNERHSAFETDCEYHGNTAVQRPAERTLGNVAARAAQGSGAGSRQTMPDGRRPGAQRGSLYMPQKKSDSAAGEIHPAAKLMGTVFACIVFMFYFSAIVMSCIPDL